MLFFQESWVKENWAVVLGIGLAVLLCITAGVVYAMRKRYTYELRHEKRCVMHVRTVKTPVSLHMIVDT